MGTTGQSITLANSIIGVGILAMPFCFQQCGVLLATLILVSMGLISRLCCYFLLKAALLARRRNFEFLAFHVFGSAGKMAVEVGIIGFLMGTCIAYFVVVGDLGPQIIAKMFNINQSDILRTSIMVLVSLVCVLPLGLLRNVDSLSNVSAATIGFYFCLVLKVIEEATSQLLSNDWHTRIEMWKPSGVLQCVPIFSMALFCQTQLFEIFESLPTLSLEKMNVVTKNAINICTIVYFTLGVFGYIAFGSQTISGNILMSLSPTMASDVIKLGFVMSLAFSFPLIIFPCRASLYSFLYKKVHSSHHDHIINNSIPESSFRCITVAIIAVALFISLLLPNIELVLGLVGSTIGVLICMVFPAACFVNITFKNTNERILAKAVLVLGLIILVLGTYANLQAAETRPDRYDENITKERIDKIVEDFFEKMEKIEGKNEVIQGNNKNLADSEIQPPNPIPPESQSNEKNPIIKQEKDKEKLERVPTEQKNKEAKDMVDKVSESHPRNLKNKLLNEAKITNNESNLQNGKFLNGEEVGNKNEEKQKEEKVKTPSTQEKVQQKIDLLKQQQLIETIKQHGEEQKELIKEQKEILDELKKTKNELQQNKKELNNVEAKKIAVESIQQIANMAIKSLSGVTDTPAGQGEQEKNSEPLEKIANEAVVEIAKKAVESIEAIKEKEQAKPDNVETVNARPVNMVNPAPLQNIIVSNKKVEPVQNWNPQANVIPFAPVNHEVKVNNVPAANPSANVVIPKPNAPPLVSNIDAIKPQETIVQHVNAAPNVNEAALKQEDSNHHVNPASNAAIIKPQNVLPNVIPANENIIANQPVQNINSVNQVPKLNEENQKVHSHSPDEPQSYKQGEDFKESNGKDHLNVPLPIAMNSNSQNNQVQQNNANAEVLKTDDVQNVNNNLNVNAVKNNGAIDTNNIVNNLQNNIVNANVPARQKREVVYCTEQMLLKPEDKAICKTLIGLQDNKIPQDILSSKVDLNDVLAKSLPIDMLHIRSLKSYDENEKKR